MNIDDQIGNDRPTDRPQGPFIHILQKLQMAISQQRVIRSNLCLVLGSVFRRRRIELRHFGFAEIHDGSWRPFWQIKTTMSEVSKMHYPTHFMYARRPYFALWLYILTVDVYDRRLDTYFVSHVRLTYGYRVLRTCHLLYWRFVCILLLADRPLALLTLFVR